MAFFHSPACNLYCDGDVHALLIFSQPESTPDIFAAYAVALGCTFVSVRLAPEVDPAMVNLTMGHAWYSDTNRFGPPDITPEHVAWLVRMHIPETYTDPVLESIAVVPSKQPWYRRLWGKPW